ncbi:PIN domain-containing protein [Dyadobacter sp. NIV53]|uniref:PIN domain-containing protein n=1 Tax=Dyadobacter sp. NIV53 TaxID=2861765 RepID=UPI001C86D05D|nr:PIN domain-containing protein [Dyadobacter sp. NIV53]
MVGEIYLILDTNIWLYLANNLDPYNARSDEETHFLLYEKLEKLVLDRSIKILINDIILDEWKRNKAQTLLSVQKHSNKLKTDIDSLQRIQSILGSENARNMELI